MQVLVRVRLLGRGLRMSTPAHYEFVVWPGSGEGHGEALDDAWAQLAPSVNNRPEAIEAARFALADIILSLGVQGNFNPQWLADTAVRAMRSRSSRSGSH